MQVTIDLPDDLAKELEPERKHLAEIIRRGLARRIPSESAAAQEVIEFLGRGPTPREIVAFRPSEGSVTRLRQLLDKNREQGLTSDEEAELDEVCAWNDLFALIKVHARQHVKAASVA